MTPHVPGHPALGRQFHATTVENAAKLRASGEFEDGHKGGYGDVVNNYGKGVYTSTQHASETWAGTMRTSPVHEETGDPLLSVIEVNMDPSAKVHTYDPSPPGHYGMNAISMERHLARHPDVAEHYVAPKPTYRDSTYISPDQEMVALTAASREAGYDATQLFARNEGGADQTIWHNRQKIKPGATLWSH